MQQRLRFLGVLLFTLFFFSLSLPAHLTLAADNNVLWDGLGHNSRDLLYRSPGGAVPTGSAVRLRLRATNGDLTAAQVRVWNDRLNTSTLYTMSRAASEVLLPNDPNPYEFWEVTLPASAQPTVYWYRFIAIDGTKTVYYEDDAGRTGGWGQPFDSSQDNSWQLTIYDPTFETPDWVKNAVIYQIFPDRFRDGNPANNPSAGQFFYGAYDTIYRSNGTQWNDAICDPRSRPGAHEACADKYSQNFYGGDLQGIIDQLDYLDDLGVTALYLNPIFESPSNHKYDTTDFLKIDDNFGDLATFQTLVAQAHSRGINIILDGVFNHSSSDSIYFDRYSRWDANGNPTTVGVNDGSGACESTSSPLADWFPFFPPAAGVAPPCSDNRDYPKWFGIFDSLPVLQHDNAEVRDYFIDNGTNAVGPYWINLGADGWRLDVAPEIDHGTLNDPADDYWEDFRAAVHAVNPDAYIVGEEWGNPTSWTIGGEWDATMNYQFASAVHSFWRDTPFTDNDFNTGSSAGVLNPLAPTGFNERILNLQERYAPEAFQAMMNLLNSHDTNRSLFLLDHNAGSNNTALYANPAYDWSDAITRLKGAALLQMTMPGAPTIYYGDEVGTVGPVSYSGDKWEDDPYNRVPFPWLDQTGTPFYAHMQNSASQNNLRDYYKLLTTARNSTPALRTGTVDPLLTDDTNEIYAFGRKMADDSSAAVIAVNGSSTARAVTLDVSGYLPVGASLTDALTNTAYTVDASGQLPLNVPARGGVLLTMGSVAGRPMVVGDLVADTGSGQVTLNWGAASGADSYDVYRSRLSGGGYTLLGSVSTTTYSDTAVSNATAYYYVVVSRNTGSLLESGFSNEVTATPTFDLASAWFNLQWPPEIGTGNTAYPQPTYVLSATTPTTSIYGQIYIGGATDASDEPVPGIKAQVGYGPQGDAPTAASWRWFAMQPHSGYDFNQNNDEYVGTLLPNAVGTFAFTTRWSGDGGNTWNYTDRNGPPYDAADAGVLVVSAPGDTTPPAAPTNLRVTGTSASSVILAWDAHPNPDADLYGYEIWRQDVTAGETAYALVNTIADATAVQYIDNTVTSESEYNYYLIALDAYLNKSPQSNTVNTTAVMRMVEVTFNVTVPAPSPGTVYIAGSFGGFEGSSYPNWNPGGLALTQVSSTEWTTTLSILDGTALEYKLTRGDWERVEKEANGNGEIANRTLSVDYGTTGTQTVDHTIANWRDPLVAAYTPTGSVAPTAAVSFTWNQDVNPELTGFTLTDAAGDVEGTLAYDAATFTHTFTPAAALAEGSYTATVAGHADVNGDVQQVPATWTFEVGGDNPPVAVTAGVNVPASVTEGTGAGSTTVTFTVNLSAASTEPVTVPYTLTNGTALVSEDYALAGGSANPLTFNAGDTAKTVVIDIVRDAVDEDNETFTLTLGTPTNATLDAAMTSRTVTITDDDSTDPVDPTDPPPVGTEMLVNGGFETVGKNGSKPAKWAASGLAGGDRHVCNKVNRPNGKPDKIVAYAGNCAFQFKASKANDKPRQLSQKVDVTVFVVGDTLDLSAWVEQKNLTGKLKIQAKIKFTGLPTEKIKLETVPGTSAYTAFTATHSLTAAPRKVVVKLSAQGTRGKVYVDDISLMHTPGTTPAANTLPGVSTIFTR